MCGLDEVCRLGLKTSGLPHSLTGGALLVLALIASGDAGERAHGSFLAPRLLAALGVPDPYGDDGVLRFSLVHYNTVSDVRRLIAALEAIGF